jgi:FixJ family two-component response regulator
LIDRDKLPILVVEDDAEVRCLLQREIEDLGHPVVAVSSAEAALEAIKKSEYTVVITDIRMPGMDGVQLTQRIKETSPDTEVILITGFASVDSASRALRLGASDYLTKPFGDIARISESLDRALEKHGKRLATRERISLLEAHRDTLIHLINRLPMGVLLVGGEGHVLLTNRTAEVILADQDGLTINDERELSITAASLGSASLRDLLLGATGLTQGQRRMGGATTLLRPSEEPLLSVLVTPLGELTDPIGREQPAAAVFISDPGRRVETAEDLLRRLYGLTPTEARLTAILMQGKSLEDAAPELSISINTARTHIKRVFSKTGTTRQGDLISLLLSGPALLRLEQDD